MPEQVRCPNCQCFARPGVECDECGFHVEVYPTKFQAVDRFRRFKRMLDVIVTAPQLECGHWVLSHTSFALI